MGELSTLLEYFKILVQHDKAELISSNGFLFVSFFSFREQNNHKDRHLSAGITQFIFSLPYLTQ